MKKSTKAVLLSLLVFPGTGHFFVKAYKRGLIWAGISAALLIFIVKNTMTLVDEVMKEINVSQGAIDINQIAESANQASLNSSPLLSFANWIILGVWIFAAIDAYQVAKNK